MGCTPWIYLLAVCVIFSFCFAWQLHQSALLQLGLPSSFLVSLVPRSAQQISRATLQHARILRKAPPALLLIPLF